MTDYTGFFLNASPQTICYDTFELSHSAFSQTYRIVRNARSGLTATDENSVEKAFTWYPVELLRPDRDSTLDVVMEIQFGDLGEILPAEIDRIHADDSYDEKPQLVYRAFRSDDLSAPMLGPLAFDVEGVAQRRDGVGLRCAAKRLNRFGTGRAYTFDRFDTLRGFVT